jgi:hypothetical protein
MKVAKIIGEEKMRKLIIVFLILASALFLTQMALADTVKTIGGAGYGIYQTGVGGEFTLQPSVELSYVLNEYSNSTKNQGGTDGTFQAFCLEGTEYIYANTTFDIILNDKAVYGSIGSAGDPLSVGAAYLYHEFQKETLGAYNYTLGIDARHASAQLLQNAIWWLEGEENQIYDSSNPFEALVVNSSHFGSEAGAKADNNGTYAVGVLNLYAQGHSGDQNYLRQDQLVCLPVPEPASMLLLGSGLIGLAAFGRKRFIRRG